MSEAIERVRVLEQQSSEAALNVENERALVVERVGALEVELERMGALEVELKHEREKRVSAERQLGVETAENVEKTGALEVELERIRGQNLNRRWGEKPTAQRGVP
ncbi:hypothetical protein T484DRAFT_1762566 [Baffinella frigidus]|nr:hypothetical protein T484DRAFT_1762566 [Cryptophyta sp. CCMP2293]